MSVKPGDESQETAGGREDEDRDELVVRVREELEAARRRVREAWAQYQQRTAGDPTTREAVAVPPLLTALLGLIS